MRTRSFRQLSFSLDGTRTDLTQMGLVATQGSSIPDPTVNTAALTDGRETRTGAQMPLVFRVLDDGTGTWIDELDGYADNNTEVYFHLDNPAGDEETVYGPCLVSHCTPLGAGTEPSPAVVLVAATASGDKPSDFIQINPIA